MIIPQLFSTTATWSWWIEYCTLRTLWHRRFWNCRIEVASTSNSVIELYILDRTVWTVDYYIYWCHFWKLVQNILASRTGIYIPSLVAMERFFTHRFEDSLHTLPFTSCTIFALVDEPSVVQHCSRVNCDHLLCLL